MATKKSRKRSPTLQPKNRGEQVKLLGNQDEQVKFIGNQYVQIGARIQQVHEPLVQTKQFPSTRHRPMLVRIPVTNLGVTREFTSKRFSFQFSGSVKVLEEMARNLEKDLEIAKKSTSKSFSLNDLEQNPACKYGVCITRLKDLFKTEQDVQDWLNSRESGLPKTPMQYLEEGKFEIVERLIGMIEHGIPS